MADHDNAIEAAWAYAVHNAETTLVHLLRELRIERTDPNWRSELAPFASVWAAMITAAAAGHQTVVEAKLYNRKANDEH